MMPCRRAQRGATLAISLILLALITLLAVTSFRLGSSNLLIVNNVQQREQALGAAQGAVEQTISKTRFFTTPANAVPGPCGGVANTTCVDVNGDGVVDDNVVVLPTCIAIQPILNSQIQDSDPNAAGCLVQQSPTPGVSGSTTGNSLCANSLWNVQATATDAISSAQYVVNEGVGVEVPSTTVCP
jgi:Tfp pilus assembly protein PilX